VIDTKEKVAEVLRILLVGYFIFAPTPIVSFLRGPHAIGTS